MGSVILAACAQRPLPMDDSPAHLDSQLRIGPRRGGIGSQRVALLEQIAATGSLAAAARAVGLSYKGAWDAINAINNLADTPLVARSAGGSGGGGSQLTARGRQLVRTYRAAEEEQARFLERLNRRVRHLEDDMHLMERLAMLTSARNQLLGQVIELRHAAVNTEVEIALTGGDHLTAVITRASADNLGLENGVAITALIKASWVVVAAGDLSRAKLSTRNRLVGTVESLTVDDVASEVVIRLPGGATLAAVITRESADAMGLAEGDTATALFKASSVILAQRD
ncbi:TOBE domain-containing protein [Salinisphaera sp. T31B1]|uniref:TOBE domain-containing protein n=1 Tax=Salinisphaera sp. T31B1 TaxID=727963 RepID=UPI00333EB243